MPAMRLGKQPPRHDPRTLRLARYLSAEALPQIPPSVDWGSTVSVWGMMANDHIGDCTAAAAGHLIMLWTAAIGSEVVPPDDAIVAAYASITGYNPATGANDQGAVELDVLNYWRKSGIAGHSITAFAAIDPANHQHIQAAIALFGGAYIGLNLPKSAQGAALWDVPAGGLVGDGAPGSWGGHAVPLVAYDQSGLTCVTWGTLQRMTWAFADAYMDEAYAVLSPDFLSTTQVAASGADIPALQADLQAITRSDAGNV